MKSIKILFLSFPFWAFSCQHTTEFNPETEKAQILRLEAQARQHHFRKNAKGLVDGFSNDFLSINRGMIEQPPYDKSLQKFDAYFHSVHFVKWDDAAPPIVRFSKDGSVAYVAVDKWVVVESAEKTLDTTHFAWLSVYKKENGKWSLDAIASTNR
ncbi:nuclear transport factor 2 family protein [Flavobacterium sp.]|uniref:nuclear transport factor 2 family protein n=1 Tax=Flavobacterium sp. TaxID=239 RepID=UPI0039E39AAF